MVIWSNQRVLMQKKYKWKKMKHVRTKHISLNGLKLLKMCVLRTGCWLFSSHSDALTDTVLHLVISGFSVAAAQRSARPALWIIQVFSSKTREKKRYRTSLTKSQTKRTWMLWCYIQSCDLRPALQRINSLDFNDHRMFPEAPPAGQTSQV